MGYLSSTNGLQVTGFYKIDVIGCFAKVIIWFVQL